MKSDTQSISRYVDECCEALGLALHELFGKAKSKRDTRSVRARKALSWALRRRFPEVPLVVLARELHRDHSTFIYSEQAFARALVQRDEWAVEMVGLVSGVGVRMRDIESPLESLFGSTAAE